MRIAIFSDALPPITDGVTRTMSELARSLEAASIDFLFVSAVEPPPTWPWADRVHVVPSIPLVFSPAYRLGLPFRSDLVRRLDAFAPDLVHVVSPSVLAVYAVRYAAARRVAAVASFHTDFAACLPYYGLAALEGLTWTCMRSLYRRFAATFVPSRCVAKRLRARGIDNVRLWPRGVDQSLYSPRHRSQVLRMSVGASDRPMLLFVGRLCREKNLSLLAEAVDVLTDRQARFRLVVVGDGPLRHQIARRMPDAHFVGATRGAELAQWYASADVFVFSSTVETFGNVVLEAFASGLPVAALDAGAVSELVTDRWNGLLSKPNDPIAFADAIEALLEHPGERRRLGQNALATAARHRWCEVNGRLISQYAELVYGGERPSATHSVARRESTLADPA